MYLTVKSVYEALLLSYRAPHSSCVKRLVHPNYKISYFLIYLYWYLAMHCFDSFDLKKYFDFDISGYTLILLLAEG